MNLEKTNRHAILIAESKENNDISDVENSLLSSWVVLDASDEIKESFFLQTALVNCYNIGNRVFGGGVELVLPKGVIPNLTRFPGETLQEVLKELFEINEVKTLDAKAATILFGKSPDSENEVEVICSSWEGGINRYSSSVKKASACFNKLPLGACLASSYSMLWAFNYTFSIIDDMDNDSFIFSLWDISEANTSNGNPQLNKVRIPHKIWSAGLGHLGQAYLWVLCQFENTGIEVLLQDFDVLETENLGAQLCSFENQIGEKKTRVCATFLEKMGLGTIIIEKPFIASDQDDDTLKEFNVLLAGFDNTKARREINKTRFKICLDGATNGISKNFDSFTFRNIGLMKRKPIEVWAEEKTDSEPIKMHEFLYENSEKSGQCGVLTNIGISTPFVGLFGAAIVIAELIKLSNNTESVKTFTGNMRSIDSYSSLV
jgi:molybdopterin/thiamine biosynthesis adenylyltransferase